MARRGVFDGLTGFAKRGRLNLGDHPRLSGCPIYPRDAAIRFAKFPCTTHATMFSPLPPTLVLILLACSALALPVCKDARTGATEPLRYAVSRSFEAATAHAMLTRDSHKCLLHLKVQWVHASNGYVTCVFIIHRGAPGLRSLPLHLQRQLHRELHWAASGVSHCGPKQEQCQHTEMSHAMQHMGRVLNEDNSVIPFPSSVPRGHRLRRMSCTDPICATASVRVPPSSFDANTWLALAMVFVVFLFLMCCSGA